MKTVSNIPTPAVSRQASNHSFFGKSGNTFFGQEPASDDASFFSPVHGNTSSSGSIQAKLNISQPDDKYEQEADAVADNVVQRLAVPDVSTKPDTGVQTKPAITPVVQAKCSSCENEEKIQEKEDGTDEAKKEKIHRKPIFESNDPPDEQAGMINRKCAECEEEEEGNVQRKAMPGHDGEGTKSIESRLQNSKGSGNPLSRESNQSMSNAFGEDLSNVRIHNDSAAVEMSEQLNAQAFTHGNDIYFNAGKFDDHSSSGKHLLAHELTHTIQQGGGQVTAGNGQAVSGANRMVQKEDAKAAPTADGLISKHTSWGNLDEEELGKELAGMLPGQTALVGQVFNMLSDSDKDDVAYETTNSLSGKLSSVDENLRINFVEYMVSGFVSDDEEGAISTIWISFQPSLPDAVERHPDLWRKSLW